ncbi:hypothetical protein BSK65_10915 [Paenibacillus odorifer]|uniref:Uncharacterized protein n=1 Tax=Paenibacillus odorifer TaxID=189426 RepID=A0A1R0ZHJ6_9BACL|nr:hypothetical protein BSK65_10915 [Paenibacillus odorifer]
MSFKGVILYFRFKKMVYLLLLINDLEIRYDIYCIIALSFYDYFQSVCMVKSRYKAFNRNYY